MTATPGSSANSKSLSQRFLDAYIADPVANPWGQFYKTASSGSATGDLNQSFQQYGALVDPLALARQARSAGETSQQVREAQRQKMQELKTLRQQNYNTYKETYGAAQNLFREMSAKGFASKEEEQRARQGLAAVREATFVPYLANRGYLEAQQKLTSLGYDRARDKARSEEMVLKFGEDPFRKMRNRSPLGGTGVKEKEALQLAYNAVKNVGQGGAVTNYPMTSVGESLIKMMREPVSELSDQRWMEKYWPQGNVQSSAGYQSRPEASTTSTSGGGLLGAMANKKENQSSLNLAVGGPSNMLNTKDIKAARQEGMSNKEIRQAVRSEDIQMSARARARLFKDKK